MCFVSNAPKPTSRSAAPCWRRWWRPRWTKRVPTSPPTRRRREGRPMADVLHITRCGRHALHSDESGPSGECAACTDRGRYVTTLERVAAAARALQPWTVYGDAGTLRNWGLVDEPEC